MESKEFNDEYRKKLDKLERYCENYKQYKNFGNYAGIADKIDEIDLLKKDYCKSLPMSMQNDFLYHCKYDIEAGYDIEFEHCDNFDKVLEIRDARYKNACALIKYLTAYEKIHHVKKSYCDAIIDFMHELSEIEEQVTINQNFPKQSYFDIPSPKNLKIGNLKQFIKETQDIEIAFDASQTL